MSPHSRRQILTVLALLGLGCPGPMATAQEAAPSPIRAQPLAPGTPVAEPVATARPAPIDPSGPAKEDLLAYADLLFSREQYALAARQYQLFLQQFPRSPNAQSGWFRLGECYLQVGQAEDAATTFRYVVEAYKQGAFVGSAAYRLAVLKYNAKDFAGAIPSFISAVAHLSNAEARLQAEFYLARCYQLADKPAEAVKAYESVAAAKAPDPNAAATWKNPFRERSLLEIARLQYDVGKAPEAFIKFEELAKTAETAEYRDEAYARAGLLAAEMGDPVKSNEYLSKALTAEGDSPWKSLATVGLIFNHFTRGEYREVLAVYSASTIDAPEDTRPKMLLIVGHSHRLTDNLKAALETYELVEKNYRDRPEGAEAGYRRLQCLSQMGDAGLITYIGSYIDQQRAIDPSSEFIDLALLMRAEWHFAKAQAAASESKTDEAGNHYAEGAVDYAKVRGDKIPEKYLEPRLYKLGWCQAESGDNSGAVVTLSEFLRAFPKSELQPSALAKRAETYQSIQDYSAALADYRDIIDRFPEARETEYALQQAALIHGQRREVPEMVATYRELLEKFPNSSAAPEAHYWIGVGLFDQEKYAEAVTELIAAREADPELFGPKASLRIILCHYQSENLDALATEASAYLKAAEKDPKQPVIPPQVLSYLGSKLYERQEFAGAEPFLAAASTPTEPANTSSEVWDMLGQTRMKLGRHADAIEPLNHFLSMTQRPSLRAMIQLHLGQCYLATKDFEKAGASARDSLTSLKEGRTNAEARLLLGDIAAAQGDHAAAAREYLVVSQIFVDPEITPLALHRAALSFRQTGDAAKATELETQLRTGFPGFKQPAADR
ncbi:MAG: tetratricopeptide repeat protein [Verrucomicrobiales bacterium]|nr:tetratricopeptide repeat protein [Verrucomicrobiales bacterium]